MLRLYKSLLLLPCLIAAMGVSALELKGPLEQGGMVTGRVASESTVELDGKSVRVAEEGLFVIGFGRDAKPTASLRVCERQRCEDHPLQIAQRHYHEQRIEGVPNRTVKPPPEAVLQRIRREAAAIRAARASNSDRRDFANQFEWPLLGPVTGVFGSRRVYNGVPGRPHYGVDVARPTGTVVNAPLAGVVTLVQDDNFYSGGTLIVDHGFGISSSFIHLSEVLVKVGDEIRQGQAIARVGASGRATGPHLDWRLNWFDERLDPALLVPPMPKDWQQIER